MQNLASFDRMFSDRRRLQAHLDEKRWPDGVDARDATAKEKSMRSRRGPFIGPARDKDCGGRNGYRFSVITHTIFQDTKIPLGTVVQDRIPDDHREEGP